MNHVASVLVLAGCELDPGSNFRYCKPQTSLFFCFFFPSTLYLFCIDALRGDISEILHPILLQSWGTMAFLKNLSCQVPRRIVSVWKHPPRTTLWYFALSANTSSEWFVWDSSLRWQFNRLHCLAVRGNILSRRYFDYKTECIHFVRNYCLDPIFAEWTV